MSGTGLNVGCVVSAPFEENTYIAHLPGRTDCVVFDPGFEPDAIFEYLDEHGLTPAAIVCTHGHSDHIAGNGTLKRRWPDCPARDRRGRRREADQSRAESVGGVRRGPVKPAGRPNVDAKANKFSAAGLDFDVYETPGHSIGHVVLLCRQSEPWQLFGGDVLFRGSVGRTDFPDGDFDALRTAIHDKLFTLPDDTIVLSGHGPETTIGHEKRTNPFVGAPAGYRQ